MPCDLNHALQALVGQEVTVVADGETFTGTVANVTRDLVTLCSDGGVIYIRPDDITAVRTGNNRKHHNA